MHLDGGSVEGSVIQTCQSGSITVSAGAISSMLNTLLQMYETSYSVEAGISQKGPNSTNSVVNSSITLQELSGIAGAHFFWVTAPMF